MNVDDDHVLLARICFYFEAAPTIFQMGKNTGEVVWKPHTSKFDELCRPLLVGSRILVKPEKMTRGAVCLRSESALVLGPQNANKTVKGRTCEHLSFFQSAR